jgi:uncharacterized membrane protein HdeD (DUF308 family)
MKANKKEWKKLIDGVNSIYFVVLANYCIIFYLYSLIAPQTPPFIILLGILLGIVTIINGLSIILTYFRRRK